MLLRQRDSLIPVATRSRPARAFFSPHTTMRCSWSAPCGLQTHIGTSEASVSYTTRRAAWCSSRSAAGALQRVRAAAPSLPPWKPQWPSTTCCAQKRNSPAIDPIVYSSSSIFSSSSHDSSDSWHSNTQQCTARRPLLLSAAAVLAALSPAAAALATTSVAPPPAPGLAGALPVPLPMPLGGPEPVAFPRKTLDQRFAVLLMRSSYDAADDLDFISMEKFQIAFWKNRQAEVEGYTLQYQPLRFSAGDLTDPIYFDFISYSQYSTISKLMKSPQQVFEERYSCESVADDETGYDETLTRVVRRPPRYEDDARLPEAFFEAAGDRIYAGLRDGFRGEEFGGPAAAGRGAGLEELLGGVRRILDIFEQKGYCLKAEVTDVEESGGSAGAGAFTVRITGPATLWGLTALATQRAMIANTHDAMAIAAYLRASGRGAARELELTEAGYVERWELV